MKRVCKEPTTLPGLNRINNTVEIQISQGIGVRHLTETTTEIEDIYHIDRGYEYVVEKFGALGANIKRVDLPDPDALSNAG